MRAGEAANAEGRLPFAGDERAAIVAGAQETIAQGSRSFAVAARLFDPDMRASAMMLYAWCRHCDDVVDDQILGFRHGAATDPVPAEARLREIEEKTLAALSGIRTGEAPFDAIGDVALRHGLPKELAIAHLGGYRMDVEGRVYETIEDTLDYCYRVAGVVGVMMALVMGVGTARAPRSDVTLTLDRACDLGLGFQLTNIARDLIEDGEAGRCYVPRAWLAAEGVEARTLHLPRNREAAARLARRLLDLADPYYDSATRGLAALPPRAAWAVATALGVYRDIGRIVRARGTQAWDERSSTGAGAKIVHGGRGAWATLRSRRMTYDGGRATDLWTRPRLETPGIPASFNRC